MNVSGSPFLQYKWLKNKSAIALAISVEMVGTSWISDPRRLVIEQIMLNPPSIGSGPVKSMVTLSPHSSGTGKGCNGPGGFVV